jgi:hypothetical protein
MINILYNPVIVGLIVTIITYKYLKHKNKKKKVDLVIPIGIGIIFGLLTCNLLLMHNINITNSCSDYDSNDISGNNKKSYLEDIQSSFRSHNSSNNLMKKGISIPKELPDVWLDTYN